MCELTTAIAAVGLLVSGASTVAGISAERRQSNLIRQDLETRARHEEAAGLLEMSQVRERNRREMGVQRARFAARGFTLNSPSVITFGADQEAENAADEANTFLNRATQADGLRVQAQRQTATRRRNTVAGVGNFAADALTAAPRLFPGLAGGGSGGSVTPFRELDDEFIGTGGLI